MSTFPNTIELKLEVDFEVLSDYSYNFLLNQQIKVDVSIHHFLMMEISNDKLNWSSPLISNKSNHFLGQHLTFSLSVNVYLVVLFIGFLENLNSVNSAIIAAIIARSIGSHTRLDSSLQFNKIGGRRKQQLTRNL